MNLYIYGLESDFTEPQKKLLHDKFEKISFLKEAKYEPVIQDKEPKVIALDPEIIGWNYRTKPSQKFQTSKRFVCKRLVTNGSTANIAASKVLP